MIAEVPAELHAPWPGPPPQFPAADCLAVARELEISDQPAGPVLVEACYRALAEQCRRAGDPAAARKHLERAAEANPLLRHDFWAFQVTAGQALEQAVAALDVIIARTERGDLSLQQMPAAALLSDLALARAGGLDRKEDFPVPLTILPTPDQIAHNRAFARQAMAAPTQ